MGSGSEALPVPIPGEELTLDVLPLRKDAPIYFSPQARPDFGSAQQISELRTITAVPEYEVRESRSKRHPVSARRPWRGSFALEMCSGE